MANRVSQSMLEVLEQPVHATVNTRVSQFMLEVLCTLTAAAPAQIGTTGRWFGDLWGTDPVYPDRYDMGDQNEWEI